MAIKTYGVHDQWVDLDRTNNVEIKSTDGVIDSVKINGEEHGGGGGGSSDFSTANVTIKINAEDNPLQNTGNYEIGSLHMPVLQPVTETITHLYNEWKEVRQLNAGTTNIEYSRNVPLFKNYLDCIEPLMDFYIEEVTEDDGYYANVEVVSVTGSASMVGNVITIRGDCIINLKASGSV